MRHTVKLFTVLLLSTLFVATSARTNVNADNAGSLFNLRSTYREDAIRPPVGQHALKITVTEDGIYELTKESLVVAGFSENELDPAHIQMMYRGKSLAYQFVDENNNNTFDYEDKIRFYGWSVDQLSRYEQFFVDESVYWLWLDVDGGGTRVPTESNPTYADADPTDVEAFDESLYIEENRVFASPFLKANNFNGFDPEPWFWAKYGQRYHGRFVTLFELFVGANETVTLTGKNADAEETIVIKRFSLEQRDGDVMIVGETTADRNGEWSFDITNELNTTYMATIEGADGSEITLDDGFAVGDWTITQFFDKKRYFFDIPHPAQTDEVGTFVAEFMTRNDGTYTTEAEFAGSIGTLELTNGDYDAARGEFVNSDLQNGENMLVISGENVTGNKGTQEMDRLRFSLGSFDQDRVWFNGITVNYTRLLIADDNTLAFHYDTAGDHNFLVSGFTTNNVDSMVVWDVSDHLNPVEIALTSSDVSNASTSFQWRIGKSIAVRESARIFATERSNVRSVTADQLELYSGIDIDPADGAGAEWIAVSHANFMESTADMATYRGNTSDLSTHVVDVEHIINQYGFGYNTPEAIRNYMTRAYTDRTAWTSAPRYLLLVGDSDWNLLDRSCGQCEDWDRYEETYVVSDYQFIDQYRGMNTTDHRFSMLDGDDVIPDIAVGRIPVKTSDEVDAILVKMQQYERAIYDQDSWVSNMMFVADDQDSAGDFCGSPATTYEDARGVARIRQLLETYAPNVYEFEMHCFDNYLPSGYAQLTEAEQKSALNSVKSDVRTLIYDSVNDEGVGMINYRGHGAVDGWAAGLMNMSPDANQNHLGGWQNLRHPAVIISADCLDTEFGLTAKPSLAETLLKYEEGGSVAHFGSTGLGVDVDHTILMDGFYTGITGDDPIHTVGDAAVNAKKFYIDRNRFGHTNNTDITDWSEVLSFTVLGDPALTIPTSNPNPFPDNPNSFPDEPSAIPLPETPSLPTFDFTHRLFLPSVQGGY